MNSATRIKLSVMMFLEYAISSVWALMLYVYLKDLFGQGHEFLIGLIMACGGLGSILGPFIMGQLADRYFATERVLAFSHLGGGVLLIAASYFTTFWPIFVLSGTSTPASSRRSASGARSAGSWQRSW